MRYHFKVYKEKGGFWAQGVELEGCRTQGDSRQELLEQLQDALNLYLSEPPDSKKIFPLPRARIPKGKNIVAVSVDPRVAFAFLMRRTRLKHNLTIREAAGLLDLKHHASYQVLENVNKANPKLLTLARLKDAFPDFPLELIFDKVS